MEPGPTKNSHKKTSTCKYDLYFIPAAIIIGIAIGLAIGNGGFNMKGGEHLPDRNTTKVYRSSHGVYRHAAVAADAKICSDIGRDTMALHGGNAIDAAVSTLFCTSALHTHSTGVGGGFFAVVYHKKHGMHAIDARETAPLAASRDMFANPGVYSKSFNGGMSMGVPGLLKGLVEMHARFGSIPWKTLVTPTIRLLREGFPLSSKSYQEVVRVVAPVVEGMKGFEMFLDENNMVKPPGSIIQIPKLARTLERIAEDPMTFYNGSLAQDIVKDIKESGGIITEEDLLGYQALVKRPTQLDLPGDLTLYSAPSPAAGPTLSHALSTLSGYQMTPDNFGTDEAKIETYHRVMEALKFAHARKTGLGDPKFVDVESLTKNMTSRSYGEQTRSLIDDSKTHDVSYYGPKFYDAKQHGTSHSSIIDREGNAVSITSSLNFPFGGKVFGNRTGIYFNNQLIDFSHPFLDKLHGLHPAEPNFIQPGKRPASAMCPSIVWDKIRKKVSIVTGAAGGPKIPSALAMNIMNVLWFNMSVPEAIDHPRLYQELIPNNIQEESPLPLVSSVLHCPSNVVLAVNKMVYHIRMNIRAGLQEKGHTFLKPLGISVIQMIQVLEDTIVAGSDYRKWGEQSGY